MPADRSVRGEVLATCQELCRRGWVANHDGNLTVRLGPGRYLATPTAAAKGRVTERDLIEVDDGGRRVSGTRKPFGELSMHLAVYRARGDVGAVIHAHPPHATAIACSGQNIIERPFIAEAIVSLGDSIPLLSFTAPGSASADALAACAGDVDAVLLESHGVFAWGADVEQAYLRLELVEHLARIAVLALPLGGVKQLPEELIASLLEKRAGAGLGKAAERAGQRRRPAASAGLTSAIREEVLRALRDEK